MIQGWYIGYYYIFLVEKSGQWPLPCTQPTSCCTLNTLRVEIKWSHYKSLSKSFFFSNEYFCIRIPILQIMRWFMFPKDIQLRNGLWDSQELFWSWHAYLCQARQWFLHTLNMHPCQLTHWGRDKMAAISQTILSDAFSWMICFYCDSNFTEICSSWSNWQKAALV